jgi:hypothetical protein
MANGWNNSTWGALAWSGILNSNVEVISPGNEAWGALGWGNTSFGGSNSLEISQSSVTTIQLSLISVTGLQLNTSLNSVQAFGLAIVDVTGQQLNISQGTADAEPDAIVTGQQINTSLNSVTILAEINSGWGRLTWGQNDWNSDGLSVITSVTGQQLNVSQGNENIDVSVTVEVSSTALVGWGVVAWNTQKWGQTSVDLTQAIAEGIVDPSPDATVTGIGMTVGLSIGTVVIGTGNVTLTGQQINIAQGTAIGDANTIASVTGIGLISYVGTVFAGGTSIVIPTGNGLTIALNSINNQIWTEISTGTDATWIEIDTAA